MTRIGRPFWIRFTVVLAAEDAADFVVREMGTAKVHRDKFALFDAALGRVDPA